jgi:membrane protease YdiL (CAAX protease family)
MSEDTSVAAISKSPASTPSRPPEPALRPLWEAASFSVLLYVGWMFLAGLFQPRLEWFGRTGLDTQSLLYYLCLNGFVLVLSAAYLRGFDGSSLRALGLWFDRGWFRQASVGTAWGAGVISGTALLLVVTRAASFASVASGPLSRVLRLAAFLFLAAAFEELVFRGYAFQRLAAALGPVAAAFAASAAFGVAHYANPQATLLSTLNTTLAGLLLATARVRSRALWMPIGLHFGWNLFLGPVFSFPVSGYTFGAGGVPAPPAGPIWLTGGAYGPEGGAALTGILAAAIPMLLRFPVPLASLGAKSEVN